MTGTCGGSGIGEEIYCGTGTESTISSGEDYGIVLLLLVLFLKFLNFRHRVLTLSFRDVVVIAKK